VKELLSSGASGELRFLVQVDEATAAVLKAIVCNMAYSTTFAIENGLVGVEVVYMGKAEGD